MDEKSTRPSIFVSYSHCAHAQEIMVGRENKKGKTKTVRVNYGATSNN